MRQLKSTRDADALLPMETAPFLPHEPGGGSSIADSRAGSNDPYSPHRSIIPSDPGGRPLTLAFDVHPVPAGLPKAAAARAHAAQAEVAPIARA